MAFGADVQTIDACIGITTCIVRICAFAVRYTQAKDTAKQVESLIQQLQGVLEHLKEALVTREQSDPSKSLSQNGERGQAHLLNQINNCESTLKKLVTAVYGKVPKNESSLSDRELKRARIAFNPQKIAELKADIMLNLMALQISQLAMQR